MNPPPHSSGIDIFQDGRLQARREGSFVIALAGNPNTGKSTVFNALTGLNQHTGNWPGKTVVRAVGVYQHAGKNVMLVDLPGTYSLLATSAEEIIARDFICFADPDATVVVVDATCLERNLNLVLQVLEITPRVVICLNLMDEARRKRIRVDTERLAILLGVPVVPTAARSGKGLALLKEAVHGVASRRIGTNPIQLRYAEEIEEAVHEIEAELARILPQGLSPRWTALRLLDGDRPLLESLERHLSAAK